MDNRATYLKKMSATYADIVLTRTLMSRDIVVQFFNVDRDHYQDAVNLEKVTEVSKKAMVTRNTDMSYVQEFFDGDLLLDDEKIPYIVTFTTVDLPRLPRMDDRIIIDNVTYSVSRVKPFNRDIDSIINVLVYPERADA